MIDPAAIALCRIKQAIASQCAEFAVCVYAVETADVIVLAKGYDELLAALIAARDLIDRGGSSADVWNLIDAAIPREQP